jgi:hypothetical protein
MRAQISLEYLALSLVSLSLLCVSVMALGAIKTDSERSFRAISLGSSAQELANAMDEVCAMGDGNVRTVQLMSPLALESKRFDDGTKQGWVVRFTYLNESATLPVLCQPQDSDLPRAEVHVENEKGEITFRGS